MSTINGVVEAKGKDNKRIRVQGKWYSSFKEASLNGAEAGDTVEFEFVEKGQWLNIKGDVKVLIKGQGLGGWQGSQQSTKVGFIGLDRERSIARQNALTNARELYIAFKTAPDLETAAQEVIKIAYVFEAYTTGDLEKTEAMKAIKEISQQTTEVF